MPKVASEPYGQRAIYYVSSSSACRTQCSVARDWHGKQVLYEQRERTMRQLRQACGRAHGCHEACCNDAERGRGECRRGAACGCRLIAASFWDVCKRGGGGH